MSTGDSSAAQRLPASALLLIRLRLLPLAVLGVVLAVFTVIFLVAGERLFALLSGIVAVAAIALWWQWSALSFRAYRWGLTADTVELRNGVVFQRHAFLPRARVQNVTKTSGPIQRRYGLATVTVHSAGVNTPDIVIPHVLETDADSLRSVLAPAVDG